jgi:proline-specific peptidase
MKTQQQFIDFEGRKVWCGIVGEYRGRPPLVVIPGGPGMPHDYLAPLAGLAHHGRQVVFYDALGAGKSERPPGHRWTLAAYVGEVAAVCDGLGLERYHLFAHSAAGMAAFSHALLHPRGLVSMVLSSTPVDFTEHTQHVSEALMQLGVTREELPSFEQNAVSSHNLAVGTRYGRIFYAYMGRYLCRVRPLPEALQRAAGNMNPAAAFQLKGGRMLYTTPLKDWNITDRLGDITVPTLFTCGRKDLLPMSVCEGIQRRLPRCELAIFEYSTHTPHLEEPTTYVARLADFLGKQDP